MFKYLDKIEKKTIIDAMEEKKFFTGETVIH